MYGWLVGWLVWLYVELNGFPLKERERKLELSYGIFKIVILVIIGIQLI
jgi:hypothetical protein